MNFTNLYRVPDEDDEGLQQLDTYLLVNSVGYYEFEAYFRMSHRPRGRKDFYLGYNYYGPMTVKLGGREYQLPPGSLFVFRPGDEQYYGHCGEKKFLSYWVHFTGSGAEDVLRAAGLDGEGPFRSGIHAEIADLFERIMSELRDKKTGYELASAAHLSYLFALFAREIEQASGEGRRGGDRDEIYESLKYIHDHYADELYVPALAERAHLSADRYTTLFKAVTNKTPQRYMNEFRLQKACELMKHTRLNIQQIAGLVGFNDSLYFSRTFKKTYGVTPSVYRAKYE
ncbi:helix-turn-helix domain-containing protein [Cohnella soli]|uniref:Helix-turn-helix domain-containing protein n=1 Tax=Cohnella soli TaxID=425005 RepID=A0ABW0I1L6_9BACL